MTEMAPAITFTRGNLADNKLGSTGQLLPNTRFVCYYDELTFVLFFFRMKVLDLTNGEEMLAGETGELCFQGPQESYFYKKISINL